MSALVRIPAARRSSMNPACSGGPSRAVSSSGVGKSWRSAGSWWAGDVRTAGFRRSGRRSRDRVYWRGRRSRTRAAGWSSPSKPCRSAWWALKRDGRRPPDCAVAGGVAAAAGRSGSGELGLAGPSEQLAQHGFHLLRPFRSAEWAGPRVRSSCEQCGSVCAPSESPPSSVRRVEAVAGFTVGPQRRFLRCRRRDRFTRRGRDLDRCAARRGCRGRQRACWRSHDDRDPQQGHRDGGVVGR